MSYVLCGFLADRFGVDPIGRVLTIVLGLRLPLEPYGGFLSGEVVYLSLATCGNLCMPDTLLHGFCGVAGISGICCFDRALHALGRAMKQQ